MKNVRQKTKELPAVVRALALGWKAYEGNARATRHFYFLGGRLPQFWVHWFARTDHAVYEIGGQELTDDVPRVVEWLEEVSRNVRESERGDVEAS